MRCRVDYDIADCALDRAAVHAKLRPTARYSRDVNAAEVAPIEPCEFDRRARQSVPGGPARLATKALRAPAPLFSGIARFSGRCDSSAALTRSTDSGRSTAANSSCGGADMPSGSASTIAGCTRSGDSSTRRNSPSPSSPGSTASATSASAVRSRSRRSAESPVRTEITSTRQNRPRTRRPTTPRRRSMQPPHTEPWRPPLSRQSPRKAGASPGNSSGSVQFYACSANSARRRTFVKLTRRAVTPRRRASTRCTRNRASDR